MLSGQQDSAPPSVGGTTRCTNADGSSKRIVDRMDSDHAVDLSCYVTALGAAHGIHALRFASPGRLVGRVDPDRDALDMAEFAAEAERLLRADVSLLSDAVLNKPNVSPDIASARAL